MPNAGTIGRFCWPVVIVTGENALRVTCNGTTSVLSITLGTYRWLGDSTASDLAAKLLAALQSHGQSAGGFSVAIASDGHLTISHSSRAWTIHWAHVTTTADPSMFGCTAADFGPAGSPYTATTSLQAAHMWVPERIFVDDSGLHGEQQISRSVALGGGLDTWRWSKRSYRDLTFDLLPASKVLSEDTLDPSEAFDVAWDYMSTGGYITWTPDVTAPTTHADYVVRDESFLTTWPVQRIAELARYWRVTLPLQAV